MNKSKQFKRQLLNKIASMDEEQLNEVTKGVLLGQKHNALGTLSGLALSGGVGAGLGHGLGVGLGRGGIAGEGGGLLGWSTSVGLAGIAPFIAASITKTRSDEEQQRAMREPIWKKYLIPGYATYDSLKTTGYLSAQAKRLREAKLKG